MENNFCLYYEIIVLYLSYHHKPFMFIFTVGIILIINDTDYSYCLWYYFVACQKKLGKNYARTFTIDFIIQIINFDVFSV